MIGVSVPGRMVVGGFSSRQRARMMTRVLISLKHRANCVIGRVTEILNAFKGAKIMFAIWYDHGGVKGYVRKGDGTNDFVRDIRHATHFPTREAAEAAKPGHGRDMGGSGFKGRIIRVVREYRSEDDA
jgi:hypothetical protein